MREQTGSKQKHDHIQETKDMKVIGITGGVGAGKSTVLTILENNYKCRIIMADDVAKNITLPGGPAYGPVVARFGIEILDTDGEIDRRILADRVFNDPEGLQFMNELIHPLTKIMILDIIKECRSDRLYDYVFIEAALLIEDGYKNICDELWYIYVPETTRRQRLRDSRNYSDEKTDSIIRNQLSEERFREECDHIIDNSGPVEDVVSQIQKILEDKV